MAHEELISALIQGIRDCDSMNGSYIYVSRNDAVQLVRILTGDMAEETLKRMGTGQKQFYCPDCSESFWAPAKDPSPPITTRPSIPCFLQILAASFCPSSVRNSAQRAV